MTSSQRVQGALICAVATVAGVGFAVGVWAESYWALAIPLAALVLFVLGLVFWVGWTILTVRVDAEADEIADTLADDDPDAGAGPKDGDG